MSQSYQKFVHSVRFRRLVVLASIVLLLYAVRSVLTLVLLTFLFTYIGIRIIQAVQNHLKVPAQVIVLCLYLCILFLLFFVLLTYLPEAYHEGRRLFDYLLHFYRGTGIPENHFVALSKAYLSKMDWMGQVTKNSGQIFHYMGNMTSVGASIVLALVLSFFYLIEKKQLTHFSRLFLTSDFAWYFQDVDYFAKKFIHTFGRVMEAQLMITLINTALTTICLALLGFHSLWSIALMIFFFSLIPVAGVLLSCLPLSLIAYTQGGLRDVLYVILIISCIHLFESYVLNPKLMAKKTELPIFYTFCILLASSRLFGLWGLIVGVPIFTFLLDILGVKALSGLEEKKT
ncbi:AI-2E family transporter [Enterococcus sp. LJL98]